MSSEITPKVVADHGLKPEEYELIEKHMGRTPNLLELGIFSVMWSEHCSYKSSRKHLKGFPTTGPRVLVGPGENAGVVDIGDGQAVAFKMESHNHPSYIEPYQGAATGVGGILRDVFTMGARPIAALNSLRFGDPSHAKTAYLVEGVTAGIAGYGNAMGVPTVGGEVMFDESYNGNCLVNAFTLGLLDSDKIFLGTAAGIGNPVIYVGARTGRDGIHGATMASAEFDENSEENRPTVQVGDPFVEKLLLEACLELMKTDLVVGIQDMGAAGLTSSSVEMAGRAGNGIDMHLDLVPMREEGMTPYEIMLSESQERMLLVAREGREAEVIALFEKWGLDVAVVGKVTDSGHLKLFWHGKSVADMPIDPLTEGAPVYDRPHHRPADLDILQDFKPETLDQPEDLGAVLETLLGRPTIASKEWIYRQFDHMVGLGTVVRPGGDAAVVRVDPTGNKGVALSADCPSRMVYLDPYEGARLTVAEACRNVSVVGGEPVGLTDCLNFGNPERPEIMWQFVQAVRGIADACRELGVPVVSGNVSLYNETEGKGIFPTPTCAVVGIVPDVEKSSTTWFKQEGHEIALLGVCTGEAGGSEYIKAIFDKTAGLPPRLDMSREIAVQAAIRTLVRQGLVASAHDCADGGIAVALAESCFMGEGRIIGARVNVPGAARADLRLFAEDPSRVIVSYDPANRAEIERIAKEAGAPFAVLGTVGGDTLEIEGALSMPVAKLNHAFRNGLNRVLGLGDQHYPTEVASLAAPV